MCRRRRCGSRSPSSWSPWSPCCGAVSRLKTMPGPVATVTTGAASGLFNGALRYRRAAGDPVLLQLAGRRRRQARAPSSPTSWAPTAWASRCRPRPGLITWATLWRFLTFLLPLLAGVWLGARIFKHADPGELSPLGSADPGTAGGLDGSAGRRSDARPGAGVTQSHGNHRGST